MRKFLRNFLVIFALGCGSFSTSSCSGSKLVWCMSNGIVTYNRHTGQLEILWEHNQKNAEIIRDTVYICPNDTIN